MLDTGGLHVLSTKNELSVTDGAVCPSLEKYWFRPRNEAILSLQLIDRIGEKIENEFDNARCRVDNSAMTAIIHGELEGSWVLGGSNFRLDLRIGLLRSKIIV